MEHSFDINIAKEYGITEAILLKHIYFWVKRNTLNEKNYIDGRYWTYNSLKAFSELFPYLTQRQVRYTLDKLKEKGLILVGNFNDDPRDRTLWYTLTEKGIGLFEQKRQVAFDKKGKSDFSNLESSSAKNGKCNNKYINNNIADTDINTDIKQIESEIVNNSLTCINNKQTENGKQVNQQHTLAENEFAECIKYYQKRIHPFTGIVEREFVATLIQDYGEKLFKQGVDITASNASYKGAKIWRYLAAVLKRLKETSSDKITDKFNAYKTFDEVLEAMLNECDDNA